MRKTFKKITAIALTAVLCASLVPMSFAKSTEVLRGDANSDGAVNSTDALQILQYSVGKQGVNISHTRADLNGDGVINSTDALRVLQIAVGMDDPTTYSKGEVIKYYADALDATAYKKMTVTYETSYVSKLVNDKDSSDFIEFDESSDMTNSFVNGYDEAEYSIYEFCPDPDINPELVKSAKITKKDANTYIVKIVLVEDKADDEDYVPHKTYPYLLNYADCTANPYEDYEITDATSRFPGSEITVTVKNGCISKIVIDIPFELRMHFENVYNDKSFNATEKGSVTDVYTFKV